MSVLSRNLASPRQGYLYQALHIVYFLDHHNRFKIALKPTYVDWSDDDLRPESTPQTKAKIMKELNPDAQDGLPSNIPEPLGKVVQLNVFVDADHAGGRVTRRSQTGIIILIGFTPIIWYSKRQKTVEASSFENEFVAMKLATEMITSLCYKLRMFGVSLD